MSNSVQRALRWRLASLKARSASYITRFKSLMFIFWYKVVLGAVSGAHGVRVKQRVRIIGPGTVRIGRYVRFGSESNPSFYNNHILIITIFKESTLTIADGCTINNNNVFVVVGNIRIDDSTLTGHDCQFYDSEMHSIDKVLRHTAGTRAGRQGDIVIGKNVMIGSQVTVGPGTNIGQNSVVGMRSVTRWKTFPPDYVIIGNLARPIIAIDDALKSHVSTSD